MRIFTLTLDAVHLLFYTITLVIIYFIGHMPKKCHILNITKKNIYMIKFENFQTIVTLTTE